MTEAKMPTEGGSFTRNASGELKRQEFTKPPLTPSEKEKAAKPAPKSKPKKEG